MGRSRIYELQTMKKKSGKSDVKMEAPLLNKQKFWVNLASMGLKQLGW